ncbi:hypothetical protein [Methanolobus sp.]|jgi:hypothetical protein|uniref:hypothetical protein n=1 Tax=Methanolobus sp. TaxID=1874737 RepID=UPI0025DDE0A3|nr:hypothetical protein [Methanolobus sp.]
MIITNTILQNDTMQEDFDREKKRTFDIIKGLDIDRKGAIKQGSQYFKPLSRTIMNYANHPEAKFDGEIGVLEKRHIQTNSIVYIGKEANNIDEQELNVEFAQVFIDENSYIR